jgi:hypothetical protein
LAENAKKTKAFIAGTSATTENGAITFGRKPAGRLTFGPNVRPTVEPFKTVFQAH